MDTLDQQILEALEWPQLLSHLAGFAQTPAGAELLKNLPLGLDEAAVRDSLARVQEARALLEEAGTPDLSRGSPLETELGRARRGAVLEGTELYAVLESERTAAALSGLVLEEPSLCPLLAGEAEKIRTSQDFIDRLSVSIGAKGELLDTASPQLAALRRDRVSYAESIRGRLENLLHSRKLEPLIQDDFFTLREDRYVIPLKAGAQGQIKGIIHATSSTGATVFLEPEEVVESNNRLKMIDRDLAEEETRVRRELSDLVRERSESITANARIVLSFDILFAKARLAELLEAAVPELPGDRSLHLESLRHPLLVLSGFKVVANNLSVPAGCRALIVSGPNGGGKTVLLKALGLSVLLLKAGLPIPAAEGSKLPLFDKVFADIGDPQSLTEHLSSFTGHVRRVGKILEGAGKKSLVLLDEVMTGTAPEEGAVLARALIEYLSARVALVAVSTHYEEVKALAYGEGEGLGLSMGFDPVKRRPSYRAEPGTPSRSMAFEAARDGGFPADVIERAHALLSPDRRAAVVLLEKLDEERRALEELRRKAQEEFEETHLERKRYEVELAKIRERDRKALSAEAETLRQELSKARAILRTARREARAAPGLETAREVSRAIESAEKAVRQAGGIVEQPAEGSPVDWSKAKSGDAVLLEGSPIRAVLVELPDARGRVVISSGTGTLKVEKDRLRLPAPLPKKEKAIETGGYRVESKGAPPSSTLDLRGKREDEALSEVELFLDRASLAQLQQVIIIHGHGTGVLKKSIRKHLDESDYVASWRPGEPGEGGDGATVVKLG